MTPQPASRVHIFVRGRVQGVGFRAFVQRSGAMLGLTGWVCNVSYDQVETVAEGSQPVLEKFIETVKAGPRASRVDECRVDWEQATGEFDSFEFRYSR